MQTGLIDVVEAAYRIELGAKEWLTGILRAASPIVDAGLGVAAYTYDASNPAAIRVETFVSQGMPDEASLCLRQGISLCEPDYVRGSFLSLSCGTTSEVPDWRRQRDRVPMKQFGFLDSLGMNGMNPDGHSCIVIALLPREMTLSARRRKVLTKLTCHLAAAHRLRRSLASGGALSGAQEAILDPSGKIHHAQGEASSKWALTRLKDSAAAITRSRGSLRTSDAEAAVDEWKGLIAARWTLLEVCETDGNRYLVARQNRTGAQGPTCLTDREQQVVAFAAMGHHNKLIAYNLGISHSTVRVLMSRAAAKLGAHSREDLIGRWRSWASR